MGCSGGATSMGWSSTGGSGIQPFMNERGLTTDMPMSMSLSIGPMMPTKSERYWKRCEVRLDEINVAPPSRKVLRPRSITRKSFALLMKASVFVLLFSRCTGTHLAVGSGQPRGTNRGVLGVGSPSCHYWAFVTPFSSASRSSSLSGRSNTTRISAIVFRPSHCSCVQ